MVLDKMESVLGQATGSMHLNFSWLGSQNFRNIDFHSNSGGVRCEDPEVPAPLFCHYLLLVLYLSKKLPLDSA